MCPLANTPSRGYADYQRLENVDTGILLNTTQTNTNVTFVSPAIDVSRFQYLCGIITCNLNQVFVELDYAIDPALTVFVSTLGFTVASQQGAGIQPHIINLGPFVRVSLFAIASANYTATLKLFASNRVGITQEIPFVPQLMSLQNTNEAAGTTTFNPGSLFCGPVHLFSIVPVLGTSIQLQVMDGTGTWGVYDEVVTTVANQVVSTIMQTPLGSWRIAVINPGALSAGFTLSLIPVISGAS